MKNPVAIVWPEGEPREAVAVFSALELWWRMVGPMGWRASFRGKRMSKVWPVSKRDAEMPCVVARDCERTMR